MARTRQKFGVLLWAYVIMPEHVHVALLPRHEHDKIEHLRASLKRGVSKSAKAHLLATGNEPWLERLIVRNGQRRTFRFWQAGGGYDRNVWKEASLGEMIEYIHMNPVRRGLVSKPTDWYWSSAQFWDGALDVPIRMDALDAVVG